MRGGRSTISNLRPHREESVSVWHSSGKVSPTRLPQPNPLRRELGTLGLIGLARLGQLDAISTLIEKYQITAEANSGFVLLWAAGQQQFAAAEKSKSEADYETAAQTLATALKSPEANTLARAAARCRYTLAWCYYRLDQLEQAGREFSNAFPGLHESKDPLAVETAWMAFVCLSPIGGVTTAILSPRQPTP